MRPFFPTTLFTVYPAYASTHFTRACPMHASIHFTLSTFPVHASMQFTVYFPCASMHFTLYLPYAFHCALSLCLPLCVSLSAFPMQLSCAERNDFTGRTLRNAFGKKNCKQQATLQYYLQQKNGGGRKARCGPPLRRHVQVDLTAVEPREANLPRHGKR